MYPQGSLMSSFSFLIYINYLPKSLHYPCVLFTEDVTVLLQGNDKNELLLIKDACVRMIGLKYFKSKPKKTDLV